MPLLVYFVTAALLAVRVRTFIWADFTVEREKFTVNESGRYDATGSFDGVGEMYFSPERKLIEFKGLRRIELPYLGQEPDDKYEFRFEAFTIESFIAIDEGEYAFRAVNNWPFKRIATGKIRVSRGSLRRTVEAFSMDEHGQVFEGVMNRYVLPTSADAKTMLKKYDEVFFGGNSVAAGEQ